MNNKINLKLLIKYFIIIVFFSISIQAQNIKMKFDHISLPQNVVFSIVQDKRGFIWFATEDGLNRYDGSQIKTYTPDSENPEKSISNNFIYSIFEDSIGNLWIGTRGGGLNKFDYEKEEFTHYLHDPQNNNTISNNNIYTIFEDSLNNLWIGTYGGGLNKFDYEKEEFTHYLYDPQNDNSLSSNEIRAITEDSSGNLWIGTDNGGLNKFNLKNKKFKRFKHNPQNNNSVNSNYIYTICKSKDGFLWIGTRNGFNSFDPIHESFKSFVNIPNNDNSINSNYVYTIFEDDNNLLWIGTRGGGLNLFDPKINKFSHYTHNQNNIDSLSHNNVFSIYEDQSKVIWIGTLGGGVNKFDTLRNKFSELKINLENSDHINNNSILSIYQDHSGILWIGTAGGGLNKFNPPKNNFLHYQIDKNCADSLIKNDVYKIFQDHEGTLWIGTSNGIYSFDTKKETFTHYQSEKGSMNSKVENFVFSIFEDSLDNLWIGTNDGALNKFNRKNNKFEYFQPNPNIKEFFDNIYVYAIHEDENGVIWLGTGNGLKKLIFDKHTHSYIVNSFKKYIHNKNNNSLSNNVILSILEDENKNLWLGTRGGGLNKFNKETEQFKIYQKKDGLPNNVIYGILEDENKNLWLSTNKGISKFNPRKEIFKNYSIDSGLNSDEFNIGAYYKTKNGRMFFGGPNGLNYFFSKDIVNNPYLPNVVFTDFKLFNHSVSIGEKINNQIILDKSISETKEIILSSKDYVFSFDFIALHFAFPEKNSYAYIMENFEKKWNYVGNQKSATYTNLPPGKYIFKVKATNNDQIWSEKELSIFITIVPPFWKTFWFKLLIILIIQIIIYIIYRTKVSIFKKRNMQLEEFVKKRTLELTNANLNLSDSLNKLKKTQNRLVESEKMAALGQLIAGVAHEINTPVGVGISASSYILEKITVCQENIKNNTLSPDSFKKNLDLFLESSNLSLKSFKKIAKLINRFKKLTATSSVGERTSFLLEKLLKKIIYNFKVDPKNKNYIIETKFEKDFLINSFPLEITQVFTNLISNSLIYGFENIHSGKITIKGIIENGNVKLFYSDNGVGISEENLEKIFNPFFTTKRASSGGGLGLSIVYNIVNNKLKGSISCSSNIGNGCTFIIEFPE